MGLPQLKCLRCGHKWVARTEKPMRCPKCTSPKWNEKRKEKAA